MWIDASFFVNLHNSSENVFSREKKSVLAALSLGGVFTEKNAYSKIMMIYICCFRPLLIIKTKKMSFENASSIEVIPFIPFIKMSRIVMEFLTSDI